MSYITEQLSPKEKIVYHGQIHKIMFLEPTLMTLICLLFFRTAIWYFLLGIIWLYYALKYSNIEIVITNRQIIAKQGIISVDCASMELAAIEGVRIKKSLLGMMLGYGTILICGKGGKNIGLPLLANPEKFKAELYQTAEVVKE